MREDTVHLTRRTFLKTTAAVAGGALLLEFGCQRAPEKPDGATLNPAALRPSAWLRINEDNSTTLIIHKIEMGQGVQTALAALIAEELAIDWRQIRTEWAPLDPIYSTGRSQTTAASASLYSSWTLLRQVGATARELFIAAAMARWNVAREACRAENGAVLQGTERLTYAELAEEAALLPLPKRFRLKDPSEWSLIGKSMPRLDAREKCMGRTRYGFDLDKPGLLTALVTHSPVAGGQVAGFDPEPALAVKGVRRVVALKNPFSPGVAVVADSFWAAKKGRDALEVSWRPGERAAMSDADVAAILEARLGEKAKGRRTGDPETALANAAQTIEARYALPHWTHAPMEPPSGVADVHGGVCEIWAPVQDMTKAADWSAGILGMRPENVTVRNAMMGGAFGRRQDPDYLVQAAEISQQVGAPVKLLWTREDDLRHGYYHPATLSEMRAGLDAEGMPTALIHRVAGLAWLGPPLFSGLLELDYAIPNHYLEVLANPRGDRSQEAARIGMVRSVGRFHTVFTRECFLDEIAHAAGQDPYRYRQRLLAEKPRLLAVLDAVAGRAGWDAAMPDGEAWGLALNADQQFGQRDLATCTAVAVRVAVHDGKPRATRAIVAIDCGRAVNPDGLAAQMEGCVVEALIRVLKSKITLREGRVEQGNFDDYPLLAIHEMPAVETVIIDSGEHPSGAGEAAVPQTAAAFCNALFRATGQRARTMPIRGQRPGN